MTSEQLRIVLLIIFGKPPVTVVTATVVVKEWVCYLKCLCGHFCVWKRAVFPAPLASSCGPEPVEQHQMIPSDDWEEGEHHQWWLWVSISPHRVEVYKISSMSEMLPGDVPREIEALDMLGWWELKEVLSSQGLVLWEIIKQESLCELPWGSQLAE